MVPDITPAQPPTFVLIAMAQNDAAKRAASMLTIAQLKFKQALKKDDSSESRLPPVAIELSAQFLSDLDAVLKQTWIVKHVASSRIRVASLGDYLISVSRSIMVDQPTSAAVPAVKTAARGRFVPLLIINDVLHTDKYHQRNTGKTGIFGRESMSFIPELIELAAAYSPEKDSQAEKKLRALLNYWAINQLLSADDLKSLQEQAEEALLIAQGVTPVRRRNYLLPEYHGDRNAPWHELPASYMLEQMIKHPNRPIDPRRIKVAKFDKKPVSAHVRKLLDNYFENIDLKYVPTGDNPNGETKKHKLWLDPMGQLVKQNKETGEIDTVYNGYGWSMKLCQDMQEDGVPQTIKVAREEAQREEDMEVLRPAPQQRKTEAAGVVIHRGHHSTAARHLALRTARDPAAVTAHHPERGVEAPRIAAATILRASGTNSDRHLDRIVELQLARDSSGTDQMLLAVAKACRTAASTLLRLHQLVPGDSRKLHRSLLVHRLFLLRRPWRTMLDMVRLEALGKVGATFKVVEVVSGAVDTTTGVDMEVNSVASVEDGDGSRGDARRVTHATHWLQRYRRVMATSKRKRRTTQSKSTKRPKHVDSENEASPTEDLWAAERILDERRVRGKLQYRIKWKGIDPATGDEYVPSWEPKENPTPDLVAAWEERKRATTSASTAVGPVRPEPARKARVIESSPEPSAAHTTSALSRLTTPTTTPTTTSTTTPIDETNIRPSSSVTTPIGIPTAKRPSPKIHVGHRGDSFDPDEYEPFSQLAATQSLSSAPVHTQGSELDSSQLFAARPEYESSGVVPDSQSSVGEGSFIPTTQQTTGTTQQSSTLNESQEEATEDSGLLEIVGQVAASRAPSPARSIPETIYDTTVDSQSQQQRRRLLSQEHAEIPAASAVTEKSPKANSDLEGQHESEVSTHIEDQSQVDQTSPEHPAPPSSFSATVQASEAVPSKDRPRPRPSEDQGQYAGSHGETTAATELLGGSSEFVVDEVVKKPSIEHRANTEYSLTEERTQVLPTEVQSTGLALVSEPGEPQLERSGSQDIAEASPTEHSVPVLDGAGPFPDLSHDPQPDSFDVAQGSKSQVAPAVSDDTAITHVPSVNGTASAQTRAIPTETSAAGPTQVSPNNAPQASELIHAEPSLVLSTQTEDEVSFAQLIAPECTRSRSPTVAQQTAAEAETVVQSTYDTVEEAVLRRDFALNSQTPHSTASREQNAQVVPPQQDLTPKPFTACVGFKHPAAACIADTLFFDLYHGYPKFSGGSAAAVAGGNGKSETEPGSIHTNTGTAKVEYQRYAINIHESQPQEVLAGEVITVVPAIVTTEPTVPEEPSSDNEIMSDASTDGTESLLNDDLQLDSEERIVPLFIDGRQGEEYTNVMNHGKALLDAFARDRDGFEPFAKIEELLANFHALETHFDLFYEEAGPSNSGPDPASQIEFLGNFGKENSAKFNFLHVLFHAARDEEKHIVLIIENENESLLSIIETFCKACYVQYNMPTRNRQSSPEWVKGNLLVTIFPSTTSPIIRPPDVIICLDGVQDAKVIRQKNWARHPDIEIVPVLHLVISRTVGHIERYLSSSLNRRERAHTIVASLGQMRSQLGKPIDEDMPRAPVTATLVAAWLRADEYPRDWPLGSIGSVKDVIEYQTQTSEESPVAERTKRPHEEDEALDPAKRMRLTPQPHAGPSSSVSHDNDITRISDSMPGTALDMSLLRAQAARPEEALQKERAARKAEQARYREKELAWDKQQTAHEDLTREYRILLGKQQSSEEQVKSLTKNVATLRERLEARTMEFRTRDEQLEDQRNTHSLSEDAKIAEITKLRIDVAQAIADKERAVKSATSADATLDYTKEQYRLAQEAATTSAARVAELETQVVKLSHIASGQPAELKKLHLNRQYEQQATQIKSLKAENHILKKSVAQKDDELQRAKMSVGRQGVGTRGTSVTPQPNKVRSRAASPATRLSNLRNG
ncbi:hypothetical protein SNOG_11111 [Parastagonospora nodorum SN15]|uniref:Chromo domain-containing protein n=1 Tax=Phaeosphaeria nodorum (strain SN15 / ATCC MYA-4574 / FGSC 10173) TaxID=321614 RepID=Q0UAV3_PHANO|nr:hypothetical protein SNOG_11111 [Parastagonospora nodorum SN15]EAT81610.2 hypothetical protein SNOG_11111 [Parastagonospora nodorum SN15]